ncbi:MAG TPA: DUF4249 family protein, partial [Salinivirgaceae bacterium]|nr:DUF4249 family protein [Salinivirgaceae bacterium]
ESYLSDGFEAVKDATVLIKYNDIVDTLQLAPDSVFVYQRDLEGNIYDSVLLPNRSGGAYGYYQSRNNIGFPGTLYILEVLWNGKLYTSQSRMPQAVSIDSVTYVYTQGEMGKPDYYLPHIWFRDNPATTDFYLFKTSGGGVWGRAILSDKFISNEITGLNVFRGESPNWWMTGYPQSGAYYSIEMHSIPSEAFEYYRALISQFRNDGGVYTPSPASPPTNISNGALGLLMASTVAIVSGIMPYPDF